MKKVAAWTLSIFLVSSAWLPGKEPLYEGLGAYARKVTTDSREAQRYFNQGLAFLHGFNHSAAIRSFEEAVRLDPACAMAHWGIALASGPHINFPLVPPEAAARAWKHIELARAHADSSATPVERDLIEAQARRYANPPPEDRALLDQAYSEAMRTLWQKYPDDADVGVFFAEALMNLRPWDQWTPEGQAQPGTDEVLATLETVMKLNPRHPFANHLYIHAVEASPNPERADAAAARLRDLQPGLAHNVHMPSHIDIRRGRWHEAIATNEKAVNADRSYRQLSAKATGMVPIYAAHNRHMLAYAALMTGQRELALRHIRRLVEEIPADYLKENAAMTEGFVAMPLEVLVRFGRWDDILAEPVNYPDHMPFTRAFHHAARATALAAKGEPGKARAEQALFRAAQTKVPDEHYLGNNPCAAVLAVAERMLEGEILLAEKKTEPGLAALREGLKLEDALKYDEPPGWMIPLRHVIGATLLRQERFTEAEDVYREDLKRLPGNGWSLYGLSEALRGQKNKAKEAGQVSRQFQNVWAKADIKINNSCLCQPRG